ncbi:MULTISPECIES: acyl-CoA-binding protein [Dactylosporangium]|uniref:Acyl-CoA-binding protein n=2 Tax=Dactylosporangium TaxID=35753 RepID=A0A9W6NKY0_9ACTN|nr:MULTISPECIES: acyl-CoA-binding protein [Dactylosporangium]UAB94109.1 acyl-CoA-binding protein [Dactylosporangium vinaceum]UWZ42516.1 acyl-CoA-binding protein [Dactylosporangium matsuzakiense]GLL00566.1 acyl-CoA-binding protein [Dactylosporangium matsuzakiense]
MSVNDEFQQAQVDVKKLGARPANDVLLKLYALFKQGTQGDATGGRPGMFDLTGRAKYDAWKAVAGTPQDDARQQYVELVRQLQGR